MHARIWIDVEDVLVHFSRGARPTGIQRLAFEAARALVGMAGPDRIRFLRHAPGAGGFHEVSFAALTASYEAATSAAAARPVSVGGSARSDPAAQAGGTMRRAWHGIGDRLPGEVRAAMLDVLLPAWGAVRAMPHLVRTAVRAQWRVDGSSPVGPGGPEADMVPGDVLFGLAAPWHSQHMRRARAACTRHGMRYATLVYDLIPLVRPEFVVVSLGRRYREWARTMLPLCDVPMAISHATRRDLERFAAAQGFALRAPVTVVPVGSEFQGAGAAAVEEPPREPYVLCVSTIEVRKNHELLFRVWRRLVDEMPPGTVPKLVLAGSVGWLVDDLMQQLRNAAFLDGRIEIVDSPTDAALAALYRGAMFSVYPSHYEGWGLPVVESHAFGTPVVCADSSALPEAGGTLARYFEAGSVGEAARVIRELIEAPAELAAWRAEVRAGFRPVPWRQTAEAMLRAIDAMPGPGRHGRAEVAHPPA